MYTTDLHEVWFETTTILFGGTVAWMVDFEAVATAWTAAAPPAATLPAVRRGIFVIFLTEVRLAEATGSAPASPSTGISTAATRADSASARGCAPIRPAPVRSWRHRRPI